MTVKDANNISFHFSPVKTLKYVYTVINSFSSKSTVYAPEKFLNCEHPIY